MSNADIIAQGTAAWEQEKAHRRMAWPNWKRIGLALEVIRNEAMAEAEANSPFGKKYTRAAARRLDAAGLADIPQQVRSRLMKCMAQLPAIERWLATLTDEERGRIGHPDSIWMHFIGGTAPQKSGPKQHHVAEHRRTDAVTGQYGPRPERPTQDMVRRVGLALGASRCVAPGSDLYGAATVAIEALSIEDHLILARAKAPRIAPVAAREIQHELELHCA